MYSSHQNIKLPIDGGNIYQTTLNRAASDAQSPTWEPVKFACYRYGELCQAQDGSGRGILLSSLNTEDTVTITILPKSLTEHITRGNEQEINNGKYCNLRCVQSLEGGWQLERFTVENENKKIKEKFQAIYPAIYQQIVEGNTQDIAMSTAPPPAPLSPISALLNPITPPSLQPTPQFYFRQLPPLTSTPFSPQAPASTFTTQNTTPQVNEAPVLPYPIPTDNSITFQSPRFGNVLSPSPNPSPQNPMSPGDLFNITQSLVSLACNAQFPSEGSFLLPTSSGSTIPVHVSPITPLPPNDKDIYTRVNPHSPWRPMLPNEILDVKEYKFLKLPDSDGRVLCVAPAYISWPTFPYQKLSNRPLSLICLSKCMANGLEQRKPSIFSDGQEYNIYDKDGEITISPSKTGRRKPDWDIDTHLQNNIDTYNEIVNIQQRSQPSGKITTLHTNPSNIPKDDGNYHIKRNDAPWTLVPFRFSLTPSNHGKILQPPALGGRALYISHDPSNLEAIILPKQSLPENFAQTLNAAQEYSIDPSPDGLNLQLFTPQPGHDSTWDPHLHLQTHNAALYQKLGLQSRDPNVQSSSNSHSGFTR